MPPSNSAQSCFDVGKRGMIASMTLRRRFVGSLCLVIVATACSGSHDAAPTPTTFHRTTTVSLRPLLGTETQTRTCPAATIPAVVPGTCYRVGPAFVTEADIKTADANYDDGIGKWVVTAQVAVAARPRYHDEMTRVLVNRNIAIVIDGRVVNVARVTPGITGDLFEISSHENWSMAKAIEVAAGIAKPSRPPCTARRCPTSTTGEADKVAARCDRLTSSVDYVIAISSVTEITAAKLRAAFIRAHEQVPPSLERADASERFALCSVSISSLSRDTSPSGNTTPTSTCPNGAVMAVAITYAVDAKLHVIRQVPAARYLDPDGQLSGSDPCDNLPNGP